MFIVLLYADAALLACRCRQRELLRHAAFATPPGAACHAACALDAAATPFERFSAGRRRFAFAATMPAPLIRCRQPPPAARLNGAAHPPAKNIYAAAALPRRRLLAAAGFSSRRHAISKAVAQLFTPPAPLRHRPPPPSYATLPLHACRCSVPSPRHHIHLRVSRSSCSREGIGVCR